MCGEGWCLRYFNRQCGHGPMEDTGGPQVCQALTCTCCILRRLGALEEGWELRGTGIQCAWATDSFQFVWKYFSIWNKQGGCTSEVLMGAGSVRGWEQHLNHLWQVFRGVRSISASQKSLGIRRRLAGEGNDGLNLDGWVGAGRCKRSGRVF